jgi:DNA-binding response OmpR family regulator
MASILLAEDDATERGLVARGLAADGHRVIEAENGAVALQRLLADPSAVDVLVTDVEMPELDGIELARTAIAARPGLKVLLISGFAGGLERAADLNAQGVRSLVKPVALEKVRAEVKALVG